MVVHARSPLYIHDGLFNYHKTIGNIELSLLGSVIAVLPHIYIYIYSLVGRLGYPAPPGNINLIDVPRLEKMRRKRLAMLTSWQNVPRTLFYAN